MGFRLERADRHHSTTPPINQLVDQVIMTGEKPQGYRSLKKVSAIVTPRSSCSAAGEGQGGRRPVHSAIEGVATGRGAPGSPVRRLEETGACNTSSST